MLTQPLCRRQRYRLRQWLVIKPIENDAFIADVGKEVLPFLQVSVHLAAGMHDEADQRLDLRIPDDPVCGLVSVGGIVAELAVVDGDHKVEVRYPFMVKGSSSHPPLAYEPNRMIFKILPRFLNSAVPSFKTSSNSSCGIWTVRRSLSPFRRDVIKRRFHHERHFSL